MNCDPKEEFTSSAIEKIDTPKFPGPLQQVNFLKEVQSTELCQDYTQSGAGVLPGNPHAFITLKMTQTKPCKLPARCVHVIWKFLTSF